MNVLTVTEQGTYVRKQGSQFAVLRGDETLAKVPEATLDRMVLLGAVQVSSQALQRLLSQNVAIIHLSRGGRYIGITQAGGSKDHARRLRQYAAAVHSLQRQEVAAWIVHRKLKETLDTQLLWQRRGWLTDGACAHAIRHLLRGIDACQSIPELMVVEAQAARIHFASFSQAIPPPFE